MTIVPAGSTGFCGRSYPGSRAGRFPHLRSFPLSGEDSPWPGWPVGGEPAPCRPTNIVRLAWSVVVVLSACLASVSACAPMARPPGERVVHAPTEERLRARLELASSYRIKGDMKSYESMWGSERQQEIRNVQDNPEEYRRYLKHMKEAATRENNTAEIVWVKVIGLNSWARMRYSGLDEDGIRRYSELTEWWVFENGDWFHNGWAEPPP